jgi:hypothetical protein
MRKAKILFMLTTVVLVAGQLAIVRPFGLFDGN